MEYLGKKGVKEVPKQREDDGEAGQTELGKSKEGQLERDRLSSMPDILRHDSWTSENYPAVQKQRQHFAHSPGVGLASISSIN